MARIIFSFFRMVPSRVETPVAGRGDCKSTGRSSTAPLFKSFCVAFVFVEARRPQEFIGCTRRGSYSAKGRVSAF